MSDTSTQPGTPPGAPEAHGGDDHSSSGSHDAHAGGHGPAPLGPIDWKAWLAGLVGVGAGLLVAAALLIRPVA